MRFTINREEFLKGLNITSKAVNSKIASIPTLTNLKLNLNEEGLFITGSNFDLSIQTCIPYKIGDKEIIRNYKEGDILVASDLITNIVRKMESDEVIFEVIDETTAIITNSQSEYQLQSIRAKEYPDLDLEITGTQLTLNKEEFIKLVDQTTFAASIKECQRVILTALNLVAGNGKLTATATDTARMAKKTISIDPEIEFVANVPAKRINDIAHLLEETDSVDLYVTDKKILFKFDNNVVATSLIQVDYPETRNVIPHNIVYTLEVNSLEFMKAIDRVTLLSVERGDVVDLTMSSEGVQISAKSAQVGSGVEKINIFKYEGQPLSISFHSDNILAAIRALNCQDVTFEIVAAIKPFIIRNAQDDSIIQIATPVRTRY